MLSTDIPLHQNTQRTLELDSGGGCRYLLGRTCLSSMLNRDKGEAWLQKFTFRAMNNPLSIRVSISRPLYTKSWRDSQAFLGPGKMARSMLPF